MTLKKRSLFQQGLEVVALTLVIGFIGLYVDPKDPLLIHYPFSFMILWLAIVTLFYGLIMGMLMWVVFGVFSLFTYLDDPIFTSFLLENLFFVFLYGLFFYNLHSRIDKLTIRTKYLKLRLKELTGAFFTLKISHDKLESTYISQPSSIRFVIAELLEQSEHSTPEESANNTLKILRKFFMVKSASIWQVRNGKLQTCLGHTGEIGEAINKKDKLIQETLLLRKAIYLKDLEDKEQTQYVYAVPFIDKRDEIATVLIIQDIPFLFYHEDILLKINIVFNFIWTKYKKRASVNRLEQELKKSTPYGDQDLVDFKLEVIRLQNIFKDFKIDSRIYSVVTTNPYLHQSLSDYFYKSELIEILDRYVTLKCQGRFVHLLLFPFVSRSGMFEPAKDFDNALEEIENNIKMQSVDDGLKYHIGTANYEALSSKHTSVMNFHILLEEYGCVG